MLVLTRKAGENVVIGQDIVISVFRTRGGRVRLGIEAPRTLSVRRGEIPIGNPQGSTAENPFDHRVRPR
jgi:carbon storage regulator CsrA